MASPDDLGRGLLLLALVAFACDLWPWSAAHRVPASRSGIWLSVRLEDLQGPAFLLLPGVGPVLAERLEAARVAAGGVMDPVLAGRVKGVGPVLLLRWAELRSR